MANFKLRNGTAARLFNFKHFKDFVKEYITYVINDLNHFEERFSNILKIFLLKKSDPDLVQLFRIRPGQKVTDLSGSINTHTHLLYLLCSESGERGSPLEGGQHRRPQLYVWGRLLQLRGRDTFQLYQWKELFKTKRKSRTVPV